MDSTELGYSAVSYAELVELVEQRVDASYAPTVGARQMLLDLVRDLSNRRSVDGERERERLLTDDGWRLTQIRIRGFGGVANSDPPLEIDMPPVDGVIVVRGQNGSGKTSVADAVRRAIEADTEPDSAGPGNLWQPMPVHRDASVAIAEVRLRRGTDELHITITKSAAGDATTVSTLRDPNGSESVTLGDYWKDALRGAQVVFEYGRMQGSVQAAVDLQKYLEGLLLLGPVWTEVRGALTSRSETARSAKKALESLRTEAKTAETTLAADFAADPRKPIAPSDIGWPTNWATDVDDWLGRNDLSGATEVCQVDIAEDHVGRLETALAGVEKAWSALDEQQDELVGTPRAEVLEHLSALATTHDLDPERCPLCSTVIRWQPVAAELSERFSGHMAAVQKVEARIGALVTLVRTEVVPLLPLRAGGPEAATRTLIEVVDREGQRARSAVRDACLRMGAAIRDGYPEWVAELRAASDAAAEWRARRCSIVTDLVARWRLDGQIAAAAVDWKKAESTLDELQKSLRDERQAELTAGIEQVIRRLLPDAGVELTEIGHTGGSKQRRGVEVKLSIGGRPASLGMLSSGQRNALLLAPLLSVRGAAPFGFLVVDDPVHALDDTRVDLLARELVGLGRQRQVVVFTHDARLEEHLRARDPGLAVRVLSRNPASGIVTPTDQSSPWRHLLDQADQAARAAREDAWPSDLGVATSVVRGLCRAALDGAVRQLVISAAVRDGRDVHQAVRRLDKEQRTAQRLRHGMSEAGGRFPAVQHCLDTRVIPWNTGAHGAADSTADLPAEIADARAACSELTGVPK